MTPVKDPNVELVIVMFIIPLVVNVSKICFILQSLHLLYNKSVQIIFSFIHLVYTKIS